MSSQELIDAICRAHQDKLIASNITNAPIIYSSDALIYRAAKQACINLGFIDKDAECLAYAWKAMYEQNSSIEPHQWPDKPAYFGIQQSHESESFPTCPKSLGLYVVAPDAAWIERLVKLNVPTVQLRFKSDDTNAIEQQVIQSIEICKNSNSRLFINDHWALAIKHGAYGVHLGQEDLDEANVLMIKQAGLRLGLSTHGYAEMIRADQFHPSYIALGAVFPTTLKKMETSPQGLGRLRAYAQLFKHYPLVGIGGIDETTMDAVLSSGVSSVAVVRAVINATNLEATVEYLLKKFD